MTPEILRLAAEQPTPGVNLGGFEPQYETPVAEVAPAAAQGPKGGDMIVVDNRDAVYDPTAEAYIFVDTGEIARKAMQRGGAVKGYKKGGPRTQDRLRSGFQGVTFGFGDEIEAGLRAAGRAITNADLAELQRYRRIKGEINRDLDAYRKNHFWDSIATEGTGAALTGLIPGAQAASGTRLASLAARMPIRAGVARAAGEGALYGAGTADRVRDVPLSVLKEGAFGAVGYPVARGVGRAASLAVKKTPAAIARLRGK